MENDGDGYAMATRFTVSEIRAGLVAAGLSRGQSDAIILEMLEEVYQLRLQRTALAKLQNLAEPATIDKTTAIDKRAAESAERRATVAAALSAHPSKEAAIRATGLPRATFYRYAHQLA